VLHLDDKHHSYTPSHQLIAIATAGGSVQLDTDESALSAKESLAMRLANNLRRAGFSILHVDDVSSGASKQFKYATRAEASAMIVIGDNELASNEVTLKDLESRVQERIPLHRLQHELQERFPAAIVCEPMSE
jgi:histidyl-tRNA synthetase